jgi:hypothetical protein
MNEIKLSSSVLLRGLNFPCWKAFYSQFTKIYLTVFICLSIPIYLSIFLAPQNGLFRFWCCVVYFFLGNKKEKQISGEGREMRPGHRRGRYLVSLLFCLFVCSVCLFACSVCSVCLLSIFFFLLLIFQFLIVSYKSLLSSYYLCFHSVGVFILHLIS